MLAGNVLTTSRVEQIQTRRKRAQEALVNQAERMVKRSRMEHAPGNPGDNVTVPVPLVDRGRGDPRNIMGVIIDRDENDMYRSPVCAGMLNGKYSRNQFDICAQKLLGEYIHLYSPERQQQQVKKAPNTQQQKQTNKREKTTLKSGGLVNSVTTFIHQRTLKTSVNQR